MDNPFRLRRSLFIALVFVAGASLNAYGDDLQTRDGRDAGGKLDVRAVQQRHGNWENRVRYAVVTFEEWSSRALRNDNEIQIFFDTDGGSRFAEHRALVWYGRGKLRACLGIYDEDSDGTTLGHCDRIKIGRPSGQKVRVSFSVNRLELKESHYGWRVVTYYTTTKKCSDECEDRAPNKGWITHDV